MADLDKIRDILERHTAGSDGTFPDRGTLACNCGRGLPRSIHSWRDHVARLIAAAVSNTSDEATAAMDRMQTQLDELRDRVDNLDKPRTVRTVNLDGQTIHVPGHFAAGLYGANLQAHFNEYTPQPIHPNNTKPTP